jgi:ethanolamine utilization microcompartment shell protein EutL
LAEISEYLPRLLDALKIPDRYNSLGIVGADAEHHGVTLQEGRPLGL